MANTNLFPRLQRLFSSNIIARNVGGNQLKIVDTNRIQSAGNLETNRLIDKFDRVWTSPTSFVNEGGYRVQILKRELYADYEIMDTDSIISSALDIYADESTLKNEFGDILTIKSNNEKVSNVLNNLFYDILNIEFNLWPWIRGMCKYGDYYLGLVITENFGITSVEPISPYTVIRKEGHNPKNPDLIQFVIDNTYQGLHSPVSLAQKRELENYEIAHFRLMSDVNFLPYGKSILEGGRKTWKQLMLMEDAMLIHRIMRAPEKRIYYVDIGNIPPNEVDAYMQKVINKMKKIPYVDPNTGDYNLKFNMQNIYEDFYLPVRGGNSGTKIDTTKGLDYNAIDDIEYLKGRLLASLKVPKAFLGFDESLSGKATLAAEDIRFSRTIERIQRIVASELTKIAIIHLYVQGFKNEDLVDFEISFTSPSIINEKEKIELWQAKINLTKDIINDKVLPRDWAYKNILNISAEDLLVIREQIVADQKDSFRFEQINKEGNDPNETGKSFGTSHDIATLYKNKGDKESVPVTNDDDKPEAISSTLKTNKDKVLGRPNRHVTTNTHDSNLGYDILGAKSNRKSLEISGALDQKNRKILVESLETKNKTLKQLMSDEYTELK